jgi:hypothetical protein
MPRKTLAGSFFRANEVSGFASMWKISLDGTVHLVHSAPGNLMKLLASLVGGRGRGGEQTFFTKLYFLVSII